MKPECDSFNLVGSGGQILRGQLHRPPEAIARPYPLVVICHGFKGFMDWGFFPLLAARLARSGRASVRFNFSHNGIGERPLEFDRLDLFERNTYSREIEDLQCLAAAIHARREPWTRDLDPERMALLGHSRGGGVAILHAARHPIWRAVATLAAIATTDRLSPADKAILAREGRLLIRNARTGQEMPIGRCLEEDRRSHAPELDIPAAAGRLAAPLLIIHGREDTSVPLAEAEALKAARPAARLEVLDGADHVLGCCHPFAGPSPQLERAIVHLDEFLAANL